MSDYHTRYMHRLIPARLRGTVVRELIDEIKHDAAARGLQLLRYQDGCGMYPNIWYALHPVDADDPATALECTGPIAHLTSTEGTTDRCAAYRALSALHAELLAIPCR